MGFEALLGNGFFTTPAGAASVLSLLFLASAILCLTAVMAANAAKKARRETKIIFDSMQSLAGEMRAMNANASEGVRVGSRRLTPEAEVDIEHHDRQSEPLELGEEDRALAAAKKAAIEPSALLRGFIRRR